MYHLRFPLLFAPKFKLTITMYLWNASLLLCLGHCIHQEYKTDWYWIQPNFYCDFVQIISYIPVTIGRQPGPSKWAGLSGYQPDARNYLLSPCCCSALRQNEETGTPDLPLAADCSACPLSKAINSSWDQHPAMSRKQNPCYLFQQNQQQSFLEHCFTHLIVLLCWNVLSKSDTFKKWHYWALMTLVSHRMFPKLKIHLKNKQTKKPHSPIPRLNKCFF